MRSLPVALMCLAGVSTFADAQPLADRVRSTKNGAVTFEFTAREGVCGDGSTFIKYGSSYMGRFSSSTRRARCDAGPVQVRLSLVDGDVDRVESWVGTPRTRDAKDLGAVPAREAARYLLDIAAHSNSGASKAILPAVLADSAVVWPTLLTIARDNRRSSNTRGDASFWLSRFAAAATSGHPNEPFDDEDPDERDDLKAHAVFVLSQLPHNEGIPMLYDVARKNPDPHVRSKALFWLGQSGDARALDLFESILR
ncbi:MAG: HEAT repeat domain-containing protein [Gemmatimonadota bacterium]